MPTIRAPLHLSPMPEAATRLRHGRLAVGPSRRSPQIRAQVSLIDCARCPTCGAVLKTAECLQGKGSLTRSQCRVARQADELRAQGVNGTSTQAGCTLGISAL